MNRFGRYVALALLVQLAAACSGENEAPSQTENHPAAAQAPAARTEAAQADNLVLAFGDSLYAGYRLGQDEGFAPMLERELTERGVSARVVNGGVSGDTTAAGLQRLAFTLDGLDRKPDLALVGLGGNDVLRGLSPDETRRNLASILDELRRRQIPVVLTGMMAPPNMGADYVGRFNAIFPELAREHGADLYPFFLDGVITRSDLLLEDGIHPNAQGVALIADRVAPVVAEALAEGETG
ncbi:arylesterase [Sphingosinicella terrae]|uniref:arylesterase n=1 Tax=Sphingosinicella terrae TaxID=2172047 RepID=UPI000E0E05F1|nr:arylesterase [Sphingosinicella terrae]